MGSFHEKHYYAGSLHLASYSSGTVEYFHSDHLGSTRLKTNALGNIVYNSNYKPYDPEYGESGSETFRYTDKHEETTRLYYFGARYYDSVTGRFTTRHTVVRLKGFDGLRATPRFRWVYLVLGKRWTQRLLSLFKVI